MKKASYSPLVLIALFLMLGGTLLVSTSKLDSGFNLISGLGVFDPVVSNVIVNSTHRTNTTWDNLTVYWTSTDADGERVINITDWRVDRRSIAVVNMPFEGDGFLNATDYSLYGNNGTPRRGPLWSNTTGKVYGAYTFNGSQYINLSNKLPDMSKFSIVVWVNYSGVQRTGTIFSDSDGAGANDLSFDMNATTIGIRADKAGTSLNYQFGAAKSGLHLNASFHHLAWTLSPSRSSIYVDGILVKTINESGSNIGNHNPGPAIGVNTDTVTYTNFFNGTIDEFRIYNRTLSAEFVRQDFLAGNRSRPLTTIVSQDTFGGEVWSACITPNDGTANGLTVCSNNNLTIYPPQIYNLTVGNITNQSAIASWLTIGLGNGTIKYGKTISLGTKASSASFNRNKSFTLNGLTNGTVYFYNLSAFDRYGHGEINGTYNFTTLQNAANLTLVRNVTITSTHQTNNTNDNLTGTWVSTDVDAPFIINVTDWRMNGTSIAILNLPFEGNSGQNTTDYSTNSMTGITVANGAIWNETISPFGASYECDGSDDIISKTSVPELDLPSAAPFSISMWLRPQRTIDLDLPFVVGTDADNNAVYFIFRSNGLLCFEAYGATGQVCTSAGSGPPLNVWTNIVGTYDGSKTRIYRNGALNATLFGTVTWDLGNGQVSMCRWTSQSLTYDGFIDEVKFYNRTLSAQQISQMARNRTNFISSNETDIGENWSLTVTPNDRISNGNPGISNIIKIGTITSLAGSGSPSSGNGGGSSSTPPLMCVPSYSCSLGDCQTTTSCVPRYCTIKWFGRIVPYPCGQTCTGTSYQEKTCGDGCSSPTVTQQLGCSCSNVCTRGAKLCSGLSGGVETTQTCGDYNGDGCSDWGPTISCSSGDTCSNGQCISPPPPIFPPVLEMPGPVIPPPVETLMGIETSITIDDVDAYSLSCPFVNKVEVTKESIKTADGSIFINRIDKGYLPVVNAFSIDCAENQFELSFAIPDNFDDVKAISCRGDSCFPIKTTKIEKLNCGDSFFKDVSRTTEYLEPEFFTIPVTKSETAPGSNYLESSLNKIMFSGDVKGSVSLEAATEKVKEAENPGIKIVGTPVVLTFSETNENLGTQITLPYVLTDNIDEFSIALYSRSNEQWNYLGGFVNITEKTVTADVKDLSKYSENKKVTVAAMGVVCLNCLDSEFKRVYDGKSRDALVLVHGFENSPARFEDILNDIRLTSQPWQAWTFGYPSSRLIDDNAKEFADHLQARSAEYDYIYVAAHSMGGIITQQMLRYAYEENEKNPGVYSFLDKVRKVVLIASPNKGAVNQGVYEDLFNVLLNSKSVQGLFSLNNAVLKDLIEGRLVERIPGVEYYVIAGTKSFDFVDSDLKNDGLVAVGSAQAIGNESIENKCDNYWELDASHTEILNNFDSRKIVERIVAKEIAEALPSRSVMGYNQYFSLNVEDCSPEDKFIIIGKPIEEKETYTPALCGCGDNVCAIGEDELSCPSDCANIRSAGTSLLDLFLHFKPLRNLSLALLVIIISIVIVHRRGRTSSALMKFAKYEGFDKSHVKKSFSRLDKKKPGQELSSADYKIEKRLNDLLVQTRICLRTGKLNGAAKYYSNFSTEYYKAPTNLKERFKLVADKLREEVRRKMI